MLRNAKDTHPRWAIQHRGKVSEPVIELTRARLCRFRELLLPLVGGLCLIFLSSSPAKAGTTISGPCPVVTGFIITVPGEYSLANDLTCTGDGIWIQVSNVTLHLQGHTITGAGGFVGIRVETPFALMTVRDVRIKGPGVVTNFGSGLESLNSADSQMKQVTVTGNGRGVLLGLGAPSGAIQSHWQFVSNTVTGNNLQGIFLANTSDCIVVQNDASNNGDAGIAVLKFVFNGGGKLVAIIMSSATLLTGTVEVGFRSA
jgi:parallel beta-helix repeat protein